MTTIATETARRVGRPHYGGSREAAAADRDRRRHEYVKLREELHLVPAALARLVGLSKGTVRNFPGWSKGLAPTEATLAKMRTELVRRARETLAMAEIERDIALREAELHIAMYAQPDEDDTREAA